MAHPYAGHKENAVGKRRASKLTSGSEYKRGGMAECRASGGRVMTAGAESGVGRLQKANGAGTRK